MVTETILANPFITQAVIPFFGAGLVGYLMGFALRKILKWVLIASGVILGAFFFGVFVMQAYGYIPQPGVNWEKMGNDISNTLQSWFGNIANGGANAPVLQVLHNLGAPISTGLAGGIILGFVRTK